MMYCVCVKYYQMRIHFTNTHKKNKTYTFRQPWKRHPGETLFGCPTQLYNSEHMPSEFWLQTAVRGFCSWYFVNFICNWVINRTSTPQVRRNMPKLKLSLTILRFNHDSIQCDNQGILGIWRPTPWTENTSVHSG